MLFLSMANIFPLRIFMLALCLVFWAVPGMAFPQEATGPAAEPAPGSSAAEEIIEFEVDDPEVIGHLREEKTSYADYEIQAAALAAEEQAEDYGEQPAAQNATTSEGGAMPYTKVVPSRGLQPTALRLFRFLPPSIFDNTIEGMREDEKQTLMDSGETEFWVLTALTDDELVIENKAPEIDTQANLILFHADNGDIIMAMGVSAGDACALELWKFRARKGGIAPLPMPDEPAVSDFFTTHRALPEDTDVSMLICLDPVEKILLAKPLIWTPSGLDQIVLDTKVIYAWNGKKFVKEVIPLR